MWKNAIYLLSALAVALATGEFSILSQPKSVIFKGHEILDQTTLKEVYSAALGFSVEEGSNWSGLYLNDPFNVAKAIATVYVDGVSDIGLDHAQHFPMKTDEDEDETFDALQSRLNSRFPDGSSKAIRVVLSKDVKDVKLEEPFKNLKIKPINTKSLKGIEDNTFINEMSFLNSFIDEIPNMKTTSNPAIYWFVVRGLHVLNDLYKENSTELMEAKQIMVDTLMRLKDAFDKAYNGKALVSVVTSDASHTRKSRSVKEGNNESAAETKDDYNLAETYSEDYPVIFNIILWFMIALFFSLLAICIFIASMDPGRDSIIYRMTSNRMKKDN